MGRLEGRKADIRENEKTEGWKGEDGRTGKE